MSGRDCLSMLELAAYRAGESQSKRVERHVADCPRCRALLAGLPQVVAPVDHDQKAPPRVAGRRIQERPTELQTGQAWAASVEGDPDWREIVVVLTRHPAVDDHELVVIAPIHTSFDEATSSDLIVDRSPLGYRHLVSVGLQGVVLRDQLERYLGRLERPEREAVADIYRSLFERSARTTHDRTGSPLVGPEDPRALARTARADELRPLFAAANRLLGHEEDEAEVPTLGTILATTIAGEEWDRPSLLSAAGVGGASFDRMLRDQLDLTDQTDVADVQRVINVIRLEDWRDPVRRSLLRSPGGLRAATGGTQQAIAARTFAGVSDAERERDLMRDRSAVDESAGAREHAIDSYLRALEKEVDDVG